MEPEDSLWRVVFRDGGPAPIEYMVTASSAGGAVYKAVLEYDKDREESSDIISIQCEMSNEEVFQVNY